MTKERAIELLTQAVDGAALKAAWGIIAKEPIAKNEDIVGLKEARKSEFTLTTTK
jgi:hypothetical protein